MNDEHEQEKASRANDRSREDEDAPSGTEDGSAGQSGRPPGETAEGGGPKGLEPTRYGDWERNGRCIDF